MINTTKIPLEDQDFSAKAQPEQLPQPTFSPFFMAIGLTFTLWGIVTGWIIGLSGMLVFFISLAKWIKDINHEETNQNQSSKR